MSSPALKSMTAPFAVLLGADRAAQAEASRLAGFGGCALTVGGQPEVSDAPELSGDDLRFVSDSGRTTGVYLKRYLQHPHLVFTSQSHHEYVKNPRTLYAYFTREDFLARLCKKEKLQCKDDLDTEVVRARAYQVFGKPKDMVNHVDGASHYLVLPPKETISSCKNRTECSVVLHCLGEGEPALECGIITYPFEMVSARPMIVVPWTHWSEEDLDHVQTEHKVAEAVQIARRVLCPGSVVTLTLMVSARTCDRIV